MAKESGEIREKATLSSHAHIFPIVGIGTSAGEFINGISV